MTAPMSGMSRMPMPPADASMQDADREAMRQYMRIASDTNFTPDERKRARAKADSAMRRVMARPAMRKAHS